MRKTTPDLAFAPVCCDWLTGRHDYAEPIPARESGRLLRIDADGQIEFESQLWEQIRCPSSDTSLRVRCDGRSLRFTGNIGRFGHLDNITGLSVLDCVEKWGEVLTRLGFEAPLFGARFQGNVAPGYEQSAYAVGANNVKGTFLTRIDLAGNFEVSDYAGLCHSALVRRIGQKLPSAGRYGPTWGYDTKRANWWKAKLYDKTAEASGKRRGDGGATLARFEVQLGAELLKRDGLDSVSAWKDADMANIVYRKFAQQVFRDQIAVQDWKEIPIRLRHWATVWRDGVDLRSEMSVATYYRIRAKLMEYGLDIAVPCNVLSLTRHVQVVTVLPVSALRQAA